MNLSSVNMSEESLSELKRVLKMRTKGLCCWRGVPGWDGSNGGERD